MKEEIINGLIDRCNELIVENKSDKENEKIYKKILQILKVDRCFDLMDVETALNILSDLGFEQEELMILYKEIIEE